jgi:hypothetical protein
VEVLGGEELEAELLGGEELEAEGEIWDWKRLYRCGSSNTPPDAWRHKRRQRKACAWFNHAEVNNLILPTILILRVSSAA